MENINGTIPDYFTVPVVITFSKGKDHGAKGAGGPVGAGTAGAWQSYGVTVGSQSQRWEPYSETGGSGWASDKGKGKVDKGKAVRVPPRVMTSGKGKAGKTDDLTAKALVNGLLAREKVPKATKEDGDDDVREVFFGGLPADTTDTHLYRLLSPFGALAINGVHALLDEDGSCKGFGWARFLDAKGAQSSVSVLNGIVMPDGAKLTLALRALGDCPAEEAGSVDAPNGDALPALADGEPIVAPLPAAPAAEE